MVKLETGMGDIIIELYKEKAPKTTANFLSYVSNGNWTDYDTDRKKRLGADADVPKRIKYRQLTR